MTRGAPERVDAVVVGARPAGSATAIALARAGRRVVALDRARFPSDTLSTHLLFAGGVAELARVGALERVLAIGAPRMPDALMAGAGETVRARYTPVDGIDYGMCVRRPGLDAALVDAARAAGADVREGAKVTNLVTRAGRVEGVRWSSADGRRARAARSARRGGGRAPLDGGAAGGRFAALPLARERPRLLLRLPGGPARRLARDRRSVARGSRARHRVPVRRRAPARAADAAARAR